MDAGDADSSLSQSRQGPPWARGGARGEAKGEARGEARGWSYGARGWSDGARGWSDGARGWSDGARGWSDGARGWSDGAKSWSAGAQGWSDGAKGWSENRGWSDGAAKGKGRSDGAVKGHAKGEAKGQAKGQAKGKGKGKGKDDDARHSLRKLQCQFLVGIEEEPSFRVIKRVLGAAGANMKRIASETDAKLRLRGRGSGFLEGLERQEAPEALMLCVSATDPESYALAVRHIQDLLTGIYAEYSKFCARDGQCKPDLEVQLHEGPRQGAFASRSSGDAR